MYSKNEQELSRPRSRMGYGKWAGKALRKEESQTRRDPRSPSVTGGWRGASKNPQQGGAGLAASLSARKLMLREWLVKFLETLLGPFQEGGDLGTFSLCVLDMKIGPKFNYLACMMDGGDILVTVVLDYLVQCMCTFCQGWSARISRVPFLGLTSRVLPRARRENTSSSEIMLDFCSRISPS